MRGTPVQGTHHPGGADERAKVRPSADQCSTPVWSNGSNIGLEVGKDVGRGGKEGMVSVLGVGGDETNGARLLLLSLSLTLSPQVSKLSSDSTNGIIARIHSANRMMRDDKGERGETVRERGERGRERGEDP